MANSKFMTGAKPSPRSALAAARPYRAMGASPASWIWLPSRLSMWNNDVNGCCVTTEEAYAKACSGIFISDQEVKRWATAHGVLEGAYLNEVLDWMTTGGFGQDGNVYDDGGKLAIDYTNLPLLNNAIYQGPVKLGVAATQLQNVAGDGNGWFGTGFSQDQNLDHCISATAYGTMAWLAQQLGVSVPSGVDGSKPGYGVFTWNTVGILDAPSMLAITGEAWLRTPTTVTVGHNPPTPDPVFTPVPVPPPPLPPLPPPTPSVLFSMTFAHTVPLHGRVSFLAPVAIPAGKYSVVSSLAGDLYEPSVER